MLQNFMAISKLGENVFSSFLITPFLLYRTFQTVYSQGTKFSLILNKLHCKTDLSVNLFTCSSRQSQIEKLGRDSLSPQELAAFQDSICSFALSQGQAIAEESLDEQSLSQLLSQHEQGLSPEGSLAKSSQSKIHMLIVNNLWLLVKKSSSLLIVTIIFLLYMKIT